MPGVYFYDHGTGSGPQLLFDDPAGPPVSPALAFSEQCCCDVAAVCEPGHPIDEPITCLKNVPASVVDMATYRAWLATLSVEAIWDDGWSDAFNCSDLNCPDNDNRLVTLPDLALSNPTIFFDEVFLPCLPTSIQPVYRTRFWIWCLNEPDPPGDRRCWLFAEIREFDSFNIEMNLEFTKLLTGAIDLTDFEVEIPLTDHFAGSFPLCTFGGSKIIIRSV